MSFRFEDRTIVIEYFVDGDFECTVADLYEVMVDLLDTRYDPDEPHLNDLAEKDYDRYEIVQHLKGLGMAGETENGIYKIDGAGQFTALWKLVYAYNNKATQVEIARQLQRDFEALPLAERRSPAQLRKDAAQHRELLNHYGPIGFNIDGSMFDRVLHVEYLEEYANVKKHLDARAEGK